MMRPLSDWFRRFFCSHAVIALATTGPAVIIADSAVIPGVEVKCARCGEFWHAELDASEAIKKGLEGAR